MTISNHITLADIPHMPVGQIAALPADQLAMLKDAADQQLAQAKSLADWLDGAISLKYADRAQTTRGGSQPSFLISLFETVMEGRTQQWHHGVRAP